MKVTFHKTWFVARYFGRGWYPETWEGWSISILYVLFVLGGYLKIQSSAGFIIFTALLTSAYLLICQKKSRIPNSKADQKEKNWKAGKIL